MDSTKGDKENPITIESSSEASDVEVVPETPLSSQTPTTPHRPRATPGTPTPRRRTPLSATSNRVNKSYSQSTPSSSSRTLYHTPSSSQLSIGKGDYLDDDDLPAYLKSFCNDTPTPSPSSSQQASFRGEDSPSSSFAPSPTSSQNRPSSLSLFRSRLNNRRNRSNSRSRLTLPEPPLFRPVRSLLSTKLPTDQEIKIGDCVELIDGTFIRIAAIEQTGGDITLKGHHLKRFKDMKGLAPKAINELLWVQEIAMPGDTITSQSFNSKLFSPKLKVVSLKEVLIVRKLIFTNEKYKKPTLAPGQTKQDYQEKGILYCRFIYTKYITSDKKARVLEESIVAIDPDQCDDGFAHARKGLLSEWRGEAESRHGKYTFGDAFCGAGGVTRGASQAGVRVKWGFDHDVQAMNSWRENFPDAIGETASIDHFLTLSDQEKKVDILHASPPCQTFSQAHTIDNQERDEKNESCITSLLDLLNHCRPRICTIEETAGLTNHQDFLKSLINTHIMLGWSVRWGLLHCADYGVPQIRRRLLMIGAAPGEILPQFPQPTHGGRPELKPWVFIEDAIRNIPPNTANHNIAQNASAPRTRTRARAPYDGKTLARTLTCKGGEWHPSGNRPFTVRETACLQTFPLDHYFVPGKTAALRQIGNAVPPRLAKAIYLEVIKTLSKSDKQLDRDG
ncbi:C-5 cytosine methyltransferase [Ascosphaera apis ARSEF 7405]|uniref:DNA (cytosine-5-)-methyltransferase n=1 Tax=Ascosphaera apis ARSEF 7405 TaxID=392613 RepID=A0A167XNV7_9EURO|nr:C-5 cytosine methyltransferase [Ascosphaera apis ARSEF 7405]